MCYPRSVLMVPANCLLLLDHASMSGNLHVFLRVYVYVYTVIFVKGVTLVHRF